MVKECGLCTLNVVTFSEKELITFIGIVLVLLSARAMQSYRKKVGKQMCCLTTMESPRDCMMWSRVANKKKETEVRRWSM